MDIKKILFFDILITPKLVTFIYWLQSLAIIIFGLFFNNFFLSGFFSRLFFIIAGLLIVRIFSEMLILAFKAVEYLRRIAEKS